MAASKKKDADGVDGTGTAGTGEASSAGADGTTGAPPPPVTPPEPPTVPLTSEDTTARELQSYKQRCAALEGEKGLFISKLEAARASEKALRIELEQLRLRLQQQAVSSLPELDDKSAELLESVTISQRGTKNPGHARKGDVVTMNDPDPVQRAVGERAKVWAVDPTMFEELRSLNMLLQ